MFKRMITWFSGKASIRIKLMISFSLLVSIPIIVLGAYIFSKTKNNLEEQTKSVMDNNLNRMVTEIGTRVKRETDNLKFLAYNLEFRKTLESASIDMIGLAQILNDSVEPTLWYFISSDEYLKGIKIYTPLPSRNIGPFLETDQEVKNQNWYQSHQDSYETLWTYEEGKLFASRSILDAQSTNRVIGVLRAEVFPGTFLEPLDSMGYLNNGTILLDKDQNILYQKQTGNIKSDTLALRLAMEEVPGGNAAGLLYESRSLEANGWRLTYYINRREITAQLYPIWNTALYAVGLSIIICVVLMTLFSKTLSTRLLFLKDKAEEIADGNFEEPLFTQDTDEIGIVTNSIADMTVRFNEMVNQVYKMKIEKQATELKALQAMINPHFLYNSLSSIKWKAIKQGNDDISDLTGHLAKFYRTSLNNGQQITTVKNELENIKSYIEIQKLTHDHKFDDEFVLQEDGLDLEILNFLLQPIVENAIKHGIDYREEQDEKGIILVEFLTEGEFLIFRIFNNGPSLKKDQLNKVINEPGKGYGICNIQQRIALYYGEGCGLSAEITPQGYVCFTVRVLKKVKLETT